MQERHLSTALTSERLKHDKILSRHQDTSMSERCYKQPQNLQVAIVPYAIWGSQTPWELGCIASAPNAMTSYKNMLDRLAPHQIHL